MFKSRRNSPQRGPSPGNDRSPTARGSKRMQGSSHGSNSSYSPRDQKPSTRTNSRPWTSPKSRPRPDAVPHFSHSGEVSSDYSAKRGSNFGPKRFTKRPPYQAPRYEKNGSKSAHRSAYVPAQMNMHIEEQVSPKRKAGPSPIPKAEPFPMRINKYLSHAHNMTRKTADSLIELGKVKINGKVAGLGDKVIEKDAVEIEGKAVQDAHKDFAYFAYSKPIGVVTHSAKPGEIDIQNRIIASSSIPPHIAKKLFPVGRLDKKSYGLIILTSDGRITDRLLNPDRDHDKEYVVTTVQNLPSFFKKHMEHGITIGNYTTRPTKVEIINDNTFSITLKEGKHHQIRRMCEALRLDVKDLKRIRIMNINLGKLTPGQARRIEGKELEKFLNLLGL